MNQDIKYALHFRQLLDNANEHNSHTRSFSRIKEINSRKDLANYLQDLVYSIDSQIVSLQKALDQISLFQEELKEVKEERSGNNCQDEKCPCKT